MIAQQTRGTQASATRCRLCSLFLQCQLIAVRGSCGAGAVVAPPLLDDWSVVTGAVRFWWWPSTGSRYIHCLGRHRGRSVCNPGQSIHFLVVATLHSSIGSGTHRESRLCSSGCSPAGEGAHATDAVFVTVLGLCIHMMFFTALQLQLPQSAQQGATSSGYESYLCCPLVRWVRGSLCL